MLWSSFANKRTVFSVKRCGKDLQASYLNEQMGREVAGGKLLVAFLERGKAVAKDRGSV